MSKEVKLSDIAVFKNGKKKPNKTGEIPVYGGNGIFDYTNEPNHSEVIIIGRVGAYCGSIHYEPQPLWVSDNAIAVKNIEGISNINYLKYLLQTLQLNKRSIGTSQPLLTQSILKDIKIKLPSLAKQEKIAGLLSSLDAKIENNNAVIANLEEQAQTIFKSWFVDFEPFQDGDFIKSELNELPEKWEIAKLSNLFEIKYGKNLPTKKLEEEGFPVFGGNGQIGYYHEYLFEEPKLLISCRGAASGKVLVSLPNSFITNNSLVMNESNRDYFYYFKYLFNTIEFENYATGSAQPQITISNIKDIEVVVPTEDIIKKFNKLLNPFFTLQLNLKKENIRLEEARDTLLPKLMSGEIRVEETIEVEEM